MAITGQKWKKPLQLNGVKNLNDLYIYVLLDQDEGTVRYVGKTENINYRVKEHLRSAMRGNTKDGVQAWIRDLKRNGKRFVCVIIDCVPIENSDAEEMAWIDHFQNIGLKLLNKKKRHK